MTILAAQADAPRSLLIRTAAANYFEKSFVKPAQELRAEMVEQRELKQQTLPLDVDRTAPIETAVGTWLGNSQRQQMAKNKAIKERVLGCAGARELLLAAGFEHRRRPLASEAAPFVPLPPQPPQPQQQEEELYVLPEGDLAELVEFRSGLATVLSHL